MKSLVRAGTTLLSIRFLALSTGALCWLGPAARGNEIWLVSARPGGGSSNGSSGRPSASLDGRWVTFDSTSSDLGPADANGLSDVYVHDRVTGANVLVSRNPSGTAGNDDSLDPWMTPDGRYVVFESLASDLVAGDSPSSRDVFLRDLVSETTSAVSVDSSGALGSGHGTVPSISDDGRYVAFSSLASNLIAGDTNGVDDIYVRDVVSGTTIRASVDSTGAQANGASTYSAISGDGRYVVFESVATNLVPGDTNGVGDVFVRDLVAGTTVRVSVGPGGLEANGDSSGYRPAISADGRRAVFASQASNLVAGDTNGVRDVFLRDLASGTTIRISVDSSGGQANGSSTRPSISADGNVVAFTSLASNLVAVDTNSIDDQFRRDLVLGSTVRMSESSCGVGGNNQTLTGALSPDGSVTVFMSRATNLVPDPAAGFFQIFAATTTLVDCNANGISDACDISSGTSADCNTNGVPDACEISSGASADCNLDAIPDECQGGTLHIVNQPPAALHVAMGDAIDLSVGVLGPPVIAYQWRHNGVPLVDGGSVSGATTSALHVAPSSPADFGSYDVLVSNPCGGPIASSASDVRFFVGTPTCAADGWGAASYQALGAGLVGAGSVRALLVHDDGFGGGAQLWAAGSFTLSAGAGVQRIARWTGTGWVQPSAGAGFNQTVRALASYDPDGAGPAVAELFAGGDFTSIAGLSIAGLARWNGTSWASVGGVGGQVNALLVDDPDGAGPMTPVIYAAGAVTAGGAHVARWNGITWTPLGLLPSAPLALAMFDDGSGAGPLLYAGGANYLARFTGIAWIVLGTVSGNVNTLATYDRDGAGPASARLCLGGTFLSCQPLAAGSAGSAQYMATWSPLGYAATQGPAGPVHALAVLDDGTGRGPVLYAGGEFTNQPWSSVRIGKWNGVTWSGMGLGVANPTVPGEPAAVDAFAAFDPDGAGPLPRLTHLGGNFANADATSANNVARVNPPAVTGCPCNNWGSGNNGCANSAFPAGGNLSATGQSSVAFDTVALFGANMTGSVAIFFQGATQLAATVIDDGIGCVGGPIIRLGAKAISGGAANFPAVGDPLISVRGGIPAGGGTYYYQCYYRNASTSFCPPATSNRTNGVAITWTP